MAETKITTGHDEIIRQWPKSAPAGLILAKAGIHSSAVDRLKSGFRPSPD